MKIQGEYIVALVLAVLGAVFSILSLEYNILGEGARVGPGFVPLISGVLLSFFGLSIGWERWKAGATVKTDSAVTGIQLSQDSQAPPTGEKNTAGSVALIFGMLLVAVFLTPIIGFLPSFSLLVFGILAGVEREKIWLSLLVSIGIGVAAWLIFFEFMGIHLPVGIILAGG